MKAEKTLATGELRFQARLWDVKQKVWGIYDRLRGSWPHTSPELGDVKQELKLELEAREEADRLNAAHPVGVKPVKEKTRSSKTVQAPVVEDMEELPEELPELPDYGIMSEEERKKYEEGLF